MLVLNWVTPLWLIAISVLYLTVFGISWFDEDFNDRKTTDDVLNYFSLIFFFIVGALFMISGYFLKRELRMWNEEVEKQARNKLNFAIYVLSIPFIVRALFNLLEISIDINDHLSQSVLDNTWLAPIVTFLYIVVSDLLPITSQLASMLVVVDEKDLSLNNSLLIAENTEEGNSLPTNI